jgi:Ras-related GTP-binding protein A/B
MAHIASLCRGEHYDSHRFERISNIIKQFKLSCAKTQSQFQGMEVRNSHFTAFVDAFTSNTYIMIVVNTSGHGGGAGSIPASTALVQMNIAAARKHFIKFIPEN